MLNKRVAAKEWLYLLTCLFIGLFIIPLILLVINDKIGNIGEFYKELIKTKWKDIPFVAWLTFVGPYLVFQLVRSILWAIKQLKD